MNQNKTVVVGLSGGVDSSVAALLLKKQGYNVIGVTMQLWQEEASENSCCKTTAVEDARRVAECIGIPFYVVNFEDVFKKSVVDDFVCEYLRGRTPNPCVVCNRKVKWEALLEKSIQLGADYIATGHYARIDTLQNGRIAVRNSVTANKDQTYALYNLTQEQLSKTLFPIGDYTKEEIREIAIEAKLPVATKADSQDICFVPDGDYASFIDRMAKDEVPKPGNFVDISGNVIGKHKGITHYTIGQRRGLEIAAGHRVFVTDIRPDANEVVIGENEDLFDRDVIVNRLNFMGVEDVHDEPIRVKAKIRYSDKGQMGYVSRIDEDKLLVRFDEPVRAAAKGQACVFYDGEYVLGGGTIC